MTIRGLYNRIQKVDTDNIAEESLERCGDELITYELDQLLDGKTSTGEDITPSYLNDPYFKSKEAAQRYSDWKDKISPTSNRKKGTPNLYINGYYHNTIRVEVTDGKVIWSSSFPDASEIEIKFKKIYGLNEESRQEFIPLILRPIFKKNIEAATGLAMK
jgi:hypothetical protein